MHRKHVIYHHHDLDGWMAAAVVAYFLMTVKRVPSHDIEFREVTYGARFDRDLPRNYAIWIVDFSFPDEDMLFIFQHYFVKAFDHHVSSEAIFKQIGDQVVMHHDTSQCGALLTWNILFPESEAPYSVRLTDDWDRWIHEYEDSKYLNAYFNYCSMSPDSFYSTLVTNEHAFSLIATGRQLWEKERWKNERDAKNNSFLAELGPLTLRCVNKKVNSSFFDNIPEDGIDGYLTWQQVGVEKFLLSAYSPRDKFVNMLEFLGKYGFKGHLGACGMTAETFKIVNRDFIGTSVISIN